MTPSKSDTTAETIILGIDPGTLLLGYGIIKVFNNKIELLAMGTVMLNKIDSHQLRLGRIFEKVSHLIDTYAPDYCAIEAPFYGKNVQSMLKLGRAQGVAMASAIVKQVPVIEYSPKKIKQSITGNGNASKEQVAAMLKQVLRYENKPKYIDATDGLAAAVCHYYQSNALKNSKQESKTKSDWKSFVLNNPGRVKSGKNKSDV